MLWISQGAKLFFFNTSISRVSGRFADKRGIKVNVQDSMICISLNDPCFSFLSTLLDLYEHGFLQF